jgi:Ca-activated chloride channel family protein
LRDVACDQKTKINLKIEELQAHGATNASDGIRHAFEIADSNKIVDGKSKIILVTDGKFQLDAQATKLLGGFKKKSHELIILLIGAKEDDPEIDKYFEKISKKGNGRYYKVDTKNLEEVLIKEASD